MYRIAIAGIATECCTFSPLPTRLEGFTSGAATTRSPNTRF